MWLGYFAAVLQVILILERILNRMVSLFVTTNRSDTKKLADNTVVGSVFSSTLTIFTMPIQAASVFLQLIFSNIYFFIAICLVAGTVIIINDNASLFMVNFVNVYNSGLGQVVNSLIQQLSIVDLVFRSVVPLYNGLVWFVTRWVWHVFYPFINSESGYLPTLIENLTMLCGSFAISLQTWITHIIACVSGSGGQITSTLSSNVTVPFVPAAVQCYGNANYLMLDLMTPSTYFVQIVKTIKQILLNTCMPAGLIMEIGAYPFLDYNTYKMVHSTINFILNLFVGLPVSTYQRCQYGKSSPQFSVVEQNVMCTPDFSVSHAMLVTVYRSAGKMIDNWFNVILALSQNVFSGANYKCVSYSPFTRINDNATSIFLTGPDGIKTVGVTSQMIAVTDGNSTGYHHLSEKKYTEWAVGNWPFAVNPRYGIASIRYGETFDGDQHGELRTGLFGCNCYDVPDLNNAGLTHMQVLCAGVPYNSFTDNETEYYASTVHPVNFYSSRTAGYMTCAKTRIKVSSMRFSRKRFSETHAFGIEGSFLDAFDSMGLNGARDPMSFTADAAVHIQPLCDGTDASCVPNIENCYPWCLGIHSAGMTASNITMLNARTWEETVRLGQVDCVVKSGQLQICDEKDKTQVINEDFGLNLQGPCVSDFPLCEADDFSATFLSYEDSASGVNPLQNTSLYQHKKNVYPLVRLEEQPFVAVGDVMLHVNDCQLVVTRLYNDNHGYFQLDNEMLTMSSNWNAPFIHFDDPSKMECIQDFGCEVEADANGNVRNLDPTCYSKAVKQGRFILPRSYFATNPIEAPAALSEWGVHWVVNPENSIFEAQFEWCRSGARKSGAIVLSSYSKARIWTMKTVRAVDTVNFGIQDTRSMSYMVVPDWLEWRENPTTVDCDNMVNLKVLDLEYINDQNILVTVLTAPPSSYMHDTVDWPICAGCPYTLTYYYLHPTRQDCIEPEESDDAHFSCWRRESEGMFTNSEMDDQTTVGELCPELRRLPEIGAAASEMVVAGVHALKMVVDLVTVLPVVGSSFDEIFDTRLNHINFHHILDGGAQALFKVDPVVNSVQKSAMLVAHGLPKLGEFFKGSEEYELMQPVLMGTAKVLQHSYVPLTGIFLQQFNTINKIPLAGIGKSRRLLQLPAAESNVRDQSVNKKAKIPSSVKNIWRQMSQFVGYTKYIGRIFSDLLRKMARSTLSLRNQNRIDRFARTQVNNVIKTANVGPRIVRANLPVASVATVETLLFSTIYDLQHDFRRTFLDNVRVQCHGVGQIFGAGKPWGSLAKHSCMLIADSAQSVMNALLVLTIEYSVLHCICKLPEEDNMLEVIQARCLPQFLPMSFRNWVLDLIRNQNGEVLSECFAIMDTSNRKLETAIDPLIRRFELIIPHIANSLDYFMTFFGMDSGKCDSFIGNPSLVTIMPQPVDWFMGCGGTSYCRMRCYDSIMSFEDELARLAEGGSTPSYSESVQVDVQSRFFSENKLINGIDLPPFAIYGMTELRPQACATVCGSSHSLNRCVAIAGFAAEPTITNTSNSSNFNAMGRLQSAYYCVPSNFMNPVYEHQMQAVLYEDEVLKNTQVLHIEFITHDQVMENKHEHLLVTGKNLISDDFSMWMFTHDGQAFDVFKTSPDGVVLYPDMLELTTIRHVHVIPGSQTTLSTVYIIGQRLMGDNSLQDACLKMTFYDMTNIPAMIQFAKDGTQFCTDYMDTIHSPQSKFVCVDELCNTFFKIPYQSSDADEIEEFTFDVTTESRSLERRYQIQQNALSSLSNVFNIDPEYPLLLSTTGMPTLNTKFMSTYSPRALGQNSVGVKRVSILIAGRLNDRAWLFNAEITLQADSYYTASLGSSMTISQQVKFLDKCSIQNCMACQSSINSHVFRDLQHKCYAASECTLINCVGTKIDVRKPLCNIGNFISGQLALASVSTQGLWMALSHTVITLVELSAARREQYAILWPQETFVSTMCVLKDTIAVQAATMTSVATAVTSMDNPDTVQDYDTAIDSNAGARQILYSISLTEVITSIMMFPVYLAIALENSLQCSLTSLMTSVSNVVSATDQIGLSGDEFEVMVLSSQEYNARTDRIAGQCLQEANPASMSELSVGKTKTELSEILTSVLSNMADMIVSVQFDPIFSLFNSFLSYTEGITISLYSLIQIVDWEDCKMSTIYTMSPASCTCGDKAMSIPHEQKKRPAAVTPSHLWCVGPLLLTDAMGADLLVWNPYSLEELLQNNYDMYLECRSKWLRYSNSEIDARALQMAETEITSFQASVQIDPEVRVMIAHIFHDALQMSILTQQCKQIDNPEWEDYDIPSKYENDVGNVLVNLFTENLGLASSVINLFTTTRKSTFSCTNFLSLGEGSFRGVEPKSAQDYFVTYMQLIDLFNLKMSEFAQNRIDDDPVFSGIIAEIKAEQDRHDAQLDEARTTYQRTLQEKERNFIATGGRQSCQTDVDCNYEGCRFESGTTKSIREFCTSEKFCASQRQITTGLSSSTFVPVPDFTTRHELVVVNCPMRPPECERIECLNHNAILETIHDRVYQTIPDAMKQSWINVINNGIGNKCDALKVENEFLLHQGVEVMQVITKCRTNYHNKEWDRGSLLLGLYSFDELRNPVDAFKKGVNAEYYMSAYESYYKKFKFIAHQSDADLIRLSLDDITHQCLYLSISAGNENHMCMEQYFRNTLPQLTTADQYFQYEPLSSANAYSFVSVDACQAYSGSVAETNADSGASNPKLIWSSKSANNLGVANLHIMNHGSQAEREAAAEERLQTLITNEIEPELAKIPLDLSNQIEISAWSVEGDEIHQLVDCVIMGPYAAADMHSTFTMSNGQSFPVPQYHRGDPGSRAFVNDGLIATKGSEARKEIMKAVQEHIAEQYDTVIMEEARGTLSKIKYMFKDVENMKCLCAESSQPSLACCSEANQLAEIDFKLNNLFANIYALTDYHNQTWSSMLDSTILRDDLWTTEDFTYASSYQFNEAESEQLKFLYVFNTSTPVREYSKHEVVSGFTQETLWSTCTSLLSSSFFTLPIKTAEQVAASGGSDFESMSVDADMAYDPASEDADDYLHGMERVIGQILKRARQDSPVFWTHVNRYIPSDSVWCEDLYASPRPKTLERENIFTPPSIKGVVLQDDTIYNQSLNETLFVADIPTRCFCDWHDGTACVVPACYELVLSSDLQAKWQALCTKQTYTSRDDLFTFMQAIEESLTYDPTWFSDPPSPYQSCPDVHPSTAWGLMDTKMHGEWYNESDDKQYVNTHELATYGPAGLRIKHLSESPNFMHDFVEKHNFMQHSMENARVNYKYGHTIGQPYCEKNRQDIQHANLSKYFRDVFFPMAHSVHEAPASAHCSTWAIEYAIEETLYQILDQDDPRIAEQHDRTRTWKARCDVQLQQIGICLLRGVYDLVPKEQRNKTATQLSPEHCPFTLDETHGCTSSKMYVTQNCLVMCDGAFYDPCSSVSARESAPTDEYELVEEGGRYRLVGDSTNNPTLKMARGRQTRVRWPGTHPFTVSDTSGYDDTPSELMHLNADSQTTIVNVPKNLTGPLYYYCSQHSSMYGVIEIVEADVEVSHNCSDVVFMKSHTKPIQDARHFAEHHAVKLYSMHWPESIDEAEAPGTPATRVLNAQVLNDQLQNIKQRLSEINFENYDLYESIKHLIERNDIDSELEHPIHSDYCDDLLDYFDATAQHPVGYHPTPASDVNHTNMRGFDSWMSQSDEYAWLLDPVRLRNMSLYSNHFGASHLTCDASVYGAMGFNMNPYYLQTKWDPTHRVDPAVNLNKVDPVMASFTEIGIASEDGFDTPLTNADGFMRHSVGLIRDWNRWYGDDPGFLIQLAHDEEWPHWTDCTECDTYGLEADQPMLDCPMPPLYTCTRDADCDGPDQDLMCLKNAYIDPQTNEVSEHGICSKASTCYQHDHCPEGFMCSGAGTCVVPRIFVTNYLETDISAQLFAEQTAARDTAQCTESMNGMSAFQNIPDFAQSHGQCSFRNWVHYTNLTRGEDIQSDGLKHIQNRDVRRSDSDVQQNLYQDLNLLRPMPTICDMDYQHTQYKFCNPSTFTALNGFGAGLQTMCRNPAADGKCFLKAVKPWTNLDSGVDRIRVRMCDLYDEYSTVSGLLSPYKYIDDNGWEQDTLDHVTSTLKRCSEFEICPELEFLVQGRGVERRQVLKVEFDNQAQEYDFKSTETRAYSHSDAEDCFGFGYHPEDSDILCVVDRYTLPIIDALFNTDEAVMDQHLPINTYETTTSTQWSKEFRETLFYKLKHGSSENDREKCPKAFSVEIEGRVDQDLFDHFFKALTRTYKISSRDTIKKYANYLLPALFGIHPETGLNRGISNIDDYVQHASCLLWISSALSRSRTLASRTNEMPYTVESIHADKVPGDSLYIFRDRAAVALDMAWFWKCVVLADPSIADGGVRRDWLEVLSNHDSEENDLTCANYDTTPNAEMTLKKRLQTAGGLNSAEVFVRYDMYSDIDNTANILNDINTVIKFALNELRLGAIPHIYCMMAKKIDIQERNDCLNVFLEYSDRVDGDRCWTKYGIDLTEIGSQTQSFVKNETTDFNSLYFKAQEFLLGTAAGGEDLYNRYATYTLANLLETGKLTEIDHNLEDIVTNEDTFFPVYSFTYIKDNMETPPDVSFRELTSLEDFETVLTTSYATKVSQGHACWHGASIPLDSSQENVFHITEPEFEITDDGYVEATAGYTQADDRTLIAEHNYDAPLIGRRYVSQAQALYLMLRVIKREIYNTISFRDGNLYLDSFKSGQSFPDFGIDLQNSLQAAKTYNDFMRKRTKACKDDKRMVLNVETNTAHRRLRNCVASMNQNIGWLIDAYDGSPGVVQIEVPSDILMNGFYLSFMERVAGDLFLDDITNSKWVNSKHTAAENLVCYQTYEGNAIPLNPLWAGNFDVVTCPAGVSCGCDTRVGVSGTRYVDAKCKRADDEQTCEELFPDMFNFVQGHCKELSQAYTATSMPNMGSLKETYTPLCQRQFDLELSTIENDEETCRFQHGTFHGHKGNRMQELIYSQHTALDSNQRGLWKQSNSIFRSRRYQPALPTSIQILNTDIAGHALEFSVDRNAQLYLRCVYTMPTEMQTPNQESDANQNQCTHSSGKWMDSVESAFKWQHNVLENAWPTPILTSTEVPWKCPLQWMTAYSNSSKSYAARVPNRDRNRIRFHHITSPHTSAHPLVSSVSPMPHLRPARFMADNIACARYSENGKANCQGDMFLQAAIQTLLSNEWTPFSLQDNSLVLGAQNCGQVLDWPHQAFTTRDQKNQDSEYEETTQCNVLGRLPPFAMRFTKTNNRYQESSTPVSVQPGGVCHMARLKRLQPWQEVCVENNIPCDTESQNSIQVCRNDNTHLTCKFLQKFEYVSNSNLLSFLDVKNITIKFLPPHKASKFNTTLSKSKLCSAHQKKNMRFKGGYTSRFGNVNPVNQSRDLMSVGLPMKLGTERLIAQYIRNITCSVASDEPCSEMKNLFNLEQWTSGLFLNSFMSANDTAGLIKNWKTNPALATHLANISFTDDQMLWERNWVFCDQASENNQGCNGSVSKQDWINPAVRPQACKQAILESKTTESLPVHFCLLDQTTQRLCERVVYWNSQIKAILCQAAGLPECPETNFFYTPSTYILENRQFVSETVFDFYESLSPSACVDSVSDELINAQTSMNQKQLTECDATIFISIKSIVQDLRRGVRGLYDVFYHTMSAITYFILTLITLIQRQDYTYFVTQFFRHLSMCMEMYFQTIVDFVLVVLAQIPGFDWIVKILCSLISSFSLVLCGFATVITETASAFTHVADGLANVPFILTSVLVTNPGQDISVTYEPFLDPLRHVMNEGKNFICNTNLKCPKLNDVKAPTPAVHLTATRCWPTYTTFFGDNDVLSCTAGDTCRKSRTSIDVALGDSQGEGLIMCGQCDDPLSTMYKFDCDTLTKMCTCSVPKFTQTSCMTNADCQVDGASCAYINNEFETKNTFTDCAACSTQKVCFKSPGAEAGVCSCSLRSIPFSTCTSDNRGQVMIPDPNKFCLYENERLFGNVVSSSSSFSRSMSISCADVLDQTTVRCRFITDFNGFYMVSQPGFGGRRLLSDTQHNLDSSITRSTVCKDALNPKNELILVHAKQECVKAYHTSLHTIQMLNLTGKVHPCTFCSMEDFKYAAWESPSLLIVLGANAQFWSHIGSLHGPGKHVSDVYQTAMLFYDVIQHDIKAPKTRPKTKVAANTSHHSHPARNLSYQESYSKFEQEHFNISDKTTPHRKLLTFENIADALRTDFEASTSMHESFASQFSSIYNYRFPELTQNQKVIWFSDWPPSHTSESLTTCNVLSDTLTLANWAVGNTTLAYTPEGRSLRNTPKKHLRDAWPRIPDRNESSINDDTDEDDTIVYWFVRGIRFVLSWISLESHDLYNVFAALMGDVLEAGTCDYTAIQTCSKWYVTLTNGFIVTTMYFSLWFILCSVFQLTFVATLTVPLFAVVLMWVCYGYSPLCVPLIPVCAMEDLHTSLSMIFPKYMRLPLSIAPNCPNTGVEGGAPYYSPACVQDCRQPPFEYDSWHAVVAWMSAEFGPSFVNFMLDNVERVPFIDHNLLMIQLEVKNKIIQDENGDLLAGNRVCVLLSSYYIMPYLMIAMVAFLAAVTVVRLLFSITQPISQLLASLYVSIFTKN